MWTHIAWLSILNDNHKAIHLVSKISQIKYPNENKFWQQNILSHMINLLTDMTLHSTIMRLIYEKFEDTNGVPRSRKSKKDRQYNGQKKKDEKTINYLQNTT